MPYITDNFQVESFYQDFNENYEAELNERTEDVELPDEAILEEETTIEGAKDAMRFINPVSLR